MVTSTLHIIAKGEGWGPESMPLSVEKMALGIESMSPQPHQTALIINNTYWSMKLMEDFWDMVLTNPIYDAGITSSFFLQKPKHLQRATRGSCIGF